MKEINLKKHTKGASTIEVYVCTAERETLMCLLPTIHSALDLKRVSQTDLKLVVLLLPQPAESYDYMYEPPRHLYSTVF